MWFFASPWRAGGIREPAPDQQNTRNKLDDSDILVRDLVRDRGARLRRLGVPLDPGRERRHAADAGDRRRRPGGRQGLSQPAIHDHRHRRDRGVPCAGLPAELVQRHRLRHRRHPVGCRRLCRHERLGPRQRAHRRGGALRRAAPGARHRLQVGRDHRHAGGRARAARRRRLLFHPARYLQRGRPVRAAPHPRGAGRARVRRLADLDLRAARRRHLHQGRRRGRRPGGQDRGRHPRG